MTKPRIHIPTQDYTAEDAELVLEHLRTGEIGGGRVRYRRLGGAFVLTDEPKPSKERAEAEAELATP